MSNNETIQEVSPEQFKIRVLKARFAERLAESEEQIAELITELTQVRQANERLQATLEESNNAKAPATTDE